ncbi:MFS transporter [Streptomyces prasinosporus]|uniref:MFS transporter n=2 Tax=Streptomyces TaxID=1883 RepID=A0ABP6TZY7_9ACTN|nr:MFS transporter [Streptomyces tricolor]MCG0062107.1 MFS transporter [Streptomyces tricolor]GHC14506.1 MFS transporter [Streptomyces albogriseolus]
MNTGLRQVFALPGYRRLWFARTASAWGDAFATVALSLLVWERTGSGLGVAGVVAAEIAPVLLLAPVAGVVVDRLAPVRVMVIADLARMLLAAALPLVDHSVPGIYAVAFAMSGASAFFNPAAGAVLPALVDEEELIAANSGIWTAAVLSQIVLAPAAGLVVAAIGYGPAFWMNAASFAASAAVLARLRLPRRPVGATRGGFWRQARDGIGVLAGHRVLRALAAGQGLAALSAGATSALLVVLVRDRLGLGPSGYGMALASIGVGAAAGPLLLTRYVSDPHRPAFVFGPYLLRAVVDAVLALVRVPVVALGSLAGYGVATSTGAVTFNSLLQAKTPPAARGRVFAAFDLIWQLGRLASLALGGWLADAAGITAVYAIGAALLAAAALIGRAASATTVTTQR